MCLPFSLFPSANPSSATTNKIFFNFYNPFKNNIFGKSHIPSYFGQRLKVAFQMHPAQLPQPCKAVITTTSVTMKYLHKITRQFPGQRMAISWPRVFYAVISARATPCRGDRTMAAWTNSADSYPDAVQDVASGDLPQKPSVFNNRLFNFRFGSVPHYAWLNATATPIPPPTQSVARPFLNVPCAIRCARCVTILAPDAPIG